MGGNDSSDSERYQAGDRGRGPTAPAHLRLARIFSVLVEVTELSRSLSFYRDVLGLHVDWNDGELALLSGRNNASHTLALHAIGTHALHYLGGTGVNRVAWRVHGSDDLDLAEQVLQRHQVRYDRQRDAGFDMITTFDPDELPVVLLAADEAALAGPPPARLYSPE